MRPGVHRRPSSTRPRGPVAVGVILAITSVAAAAAPVGSLPGSPGAAGAATQTFAASSSATVSSGAPASSVSVAVPAGYGPRRITGRITGASSGGSIRLSVGQRSRTVSVRASRFSLDLAPGDVRNGVVELGIAAGGDADASSRCTTSGTRATIGGVRVTADGTARAPTTLSTFFSPDVQAVTVLVPPGASDQVLSAGLAAVASLSARYDDGVPVTLRLGDLAPRTGSRARIVRIGPGNGDGATTSIDGSGTTPTLSVTGPQGSLGGAAQALGSQALTVADSGTASGLSAANPTGTGLRRTLAQLGNDAVDLQGYGRSSGYVAVPQTAFGGPVDGIDIRLRGTHSAVPRGTTATAQVFWNGSLVDSTVLGDDSRYSRDIHVSGSQITPNNGMRVQFNAVPSGGCSGSTAGVPMQLSIDGGSSVVEGSRGQGLPPGFSRFPQVLGSSLPVAIGSGGSRATSAAAAADLVASLQRQSSVPLRVRLQSRDAFVDSGSSGLLVGATEKDSNDLKAPLRLDRFRTIDSGELRFGVGVDKPYAALTAFQSDGRDVLLLGAWSPDRATAGQAEGLAAGLARYVANRRNGWDALNRDVAIAQPGQAVPVPVSVDSNGIVPQKARADDRRSYALWIVVAAVVLLAAGLWRVLAVRRRREARFYVDVQEALDRQERQQRGPDDGTP